MSEAKMTEHRGLKVGTEMMDEDGAPVKLIEIASFGSKRGEEIMYKIEYPLSDPYYCKWYTYEQLFKHFSVKLV